MPHSLASRVPKTILLQYAKVIEELPDPIPAGSFTGRVRGGYAHLEHDSP
jgi:hypothetical protein